MTNSRYGPTMMWIVTETREIPGPSGRFLRQWCIFYRWRTRIRYPMMNSIFVFLINLFSLISGTYFCCPVRIPRLFYHPGIKLRIKCPTSHSSSKPQLSLCFYFMTRVSFKIPVLRMFPSRASRKFSLLFSSQSMAALWIGQGWFAKITKTTFIPRQYPRILHRCMKDHQFMEQSLFLRLLFLPTPTSLTVPSHCHLVFAQAATRQQNTSIKLCRKTLS